MVGVADWPLLIGLAANQFPVFESFQALRQDVRWHAFFALLQRNKRMLTVPHQIPDNQQRPLVANDVQRSRDGALRSKATFCHGPLSRL
jgi:hypothetical protein